MFKKAIMAACVTASMTFSFGVNASDLTNSLESAISTEVSKANVNETKKEPDIKLSIIKGASDIADGEYLNYEEFMLFEYLAHKTINNEKISDADKKNLISYMSLSRFLMQMERRHEQLRQLNNLIVQSDKETSSKILQLYVAEQATLSNESFKFIKSTGLYSDQEKLNQKMVELESIFNNLVANIDYDDMNNFIKSLVEESQTEDKS